MKFEELIAKRAKEQQARKPKSVMQKSAEQKPLDTRAEVAKIANVSHDTISKVKPSARSVRRRSLTYGRNATPPRKSVVLLDWKDGSQKMKLRRFQHMS